MIDNNISKLNHKQLKQYIIELLQSEMKCNEDNIKLKIVNGLSNNNGSLSMSKNLKSATISIYISKLLKSDSSNIKVIINSYNTLCHELEHSKSFFKTKDEDFYSYEHLITILEYAYYANIFKINPNKTGFMVFNILPLKKILNNNYESSISEINASLVGYTKSLNRFGDYIDKDDIKLYSNIITSLKFLDENLEISYDIVKNPSNRFSTYIAGSINFLKEHSDLIQQYSILKNLFNDDSSIKNIYELYLKINDSNKVMYDRLIMNLLTSVKCDYSNYFKDEGFKKYIERLIEDYINNVINYYKNMQLGSVFIKNNKTLTANLILKKKNIMILNEIINKYNLSINAGTVLDNTLCYRQNQLF